MKKPIILYEGEYTEKDLEQFKQKHPIIAVHDIYQRQLKELFEIFYPFLRNTSEYAIQLRQFIHMHVQTNPMLCGNWVYFPWNGILIHTVKQDNYDLLRTNRNQNLVTAAEQKKLFDFTPAVVGLSVGSHMALTLSYHGIGKTIKIADHDQLETTNLNRIRAGLQHIGMSKTTLLAQQLYEGNPYLNILEYSEGLTKDNLSEFLKGDVSPKIIFEVIDNFEMKIRLRLAARAAKIPVVMMANLGDSILVDIERYDLDKSLPLFNGVIGNLPEQILNQPDITDDDKNRYAVKMVGIENISEKAIKSVQEINKTLVGRPQLISTVTICGGIAAFFARSIALGVNVPSGRKLIKLSNLFIKNDYYENK